MSSVERQPLLPPRVAQRPDPAQWSEAELMTLAEAAALHWPLGYPITSSGLRRLAKAKRLDVVIINRKVLTCRAAIARMSSCRPNPRGAARIEQDDPLPEPMRRALGRMCRP